jgi:hypothetical protein
MPRVTKAGNPGNWYVCSGEGPQPLAQGPGMFEVSSDSVSTIDVLVYDFVDQKNGKILEPGKTVIVQITAGLFLAPNPPDSGTAKGEYCNVSP